MTIRWDSSQVDRALANLAKADLTAIPLAGGIRLASIMAENAPVLTGNLRRSLHAEEVGQVGDIIEVQAGTNVEYAPDTEFRSSRPGWAAKSLREAEGPVLEDMAEAARQIIEGAGG